MLATVGLPSHALVRSIVATALAIGLGTALLAPATAQAGARLSDLAALARARNERQRPIMEARLAQYLGDLAMDYGDAGNRAFLEKRIAEAAALGDSLVPLLLEKIKPADTGPQDLNTAANSARVLARLGPAGFVSPLIEMVRGDNSIARGHAIVLLGKSGHPEAARFLEGVLPTLPKSNLAAAVYALRLLERRSAAAKVAALLGTGDASVRTAALDFLTNLGDGQETKRVLAALKAETQESLLASYLAFLQRHAPGDGDAATALLALLEPGKLLSPRQRDVVNALATIAPKGHEPTTTRLRAIITGGEVQQLGIDCAQTMLALGDKSGRKELLEAVEKEARRTPKVPIVLANRGEALYAFDKWDDALRDFKEAERLTRSSPMKRAYTVWMARCHVRLQQARRAAVLLREAGVSKLDLDTATAVDPAFKQALAEQPDLRALVRELAR